MEGAEILWRLEHLGNAAEFMRRDAGGITEFADVLLAEEGPMFFELVDVDGAEGRIGCSRKPRLSESDELSGKQLPCRLVCAACVATRNAVAQRISGVGQNTAASATDDACPQVGQPVFVALATWAFMSRRGCVEKFDPPS